MEATRGKSMSTTKELLEELQASISRVQALLEQAQQPYLPLARLPKGHQLTSTEIRRSY